MADTIEKVETNIEGRDRDDIGNSKEENQFNFGAGVHQEVDPRWKHPGEWQYEEDGMIVTRTSVWSAPGCHEGCGVLVYSDKETGRFIKCEGDPDDPYNRGALCPRCLAFKQVEFHPDRILYPMKRAGERGDGGDRDGRRAHSDERHRRQGRRGNGALGAGAERGDRPERDP